MTLTTLQSMSVPKDGQRKLKLRDFKDTKKIDGVTE
jgi:hypothetical protein